MLSEIESGSGGDGSELEQFYQQNHEYADRYKFWASKSTPGMEIRKIHTGFSALTVKVLCSTIMSAMNDFEFKDPEQEELYGDTLDEHCKQNKGSRGWENRGLNARGSERASAAKFTRR